MNTVTFVSTSDWHWQLANPRARLDSYSEALTAKITEVYEIARQEAAKGILVPGDVFNSPSVGFSAVGALMALLIQAPCPVYATAGQHDEWDHSPHSLPRTPFGLLTCAGLIHDVAAAPVMIELPWPNSDNGPAHLQITGRHYDHEADASEGYYEPPETTEKPDLRIMLSHGMVLEQDPGFQIKHTLVSKIRSSANVICVGDYHTGIGVRSFERTQGAKGLVINPGALARMKAAIEEFERKVQVAVITVTEQHVFAKLVPLKSARPAEEVLSREHLVAAAEREEKMARFLGLLAEQGESRFLDIRDIVASISASEKIGRPVVDSALGYLARARESLAGVSQ